MWLFIIETAIIGPSFGEFFDHGLEIFFLSLELFLFLLKNDLGFVLVFFYHEVKLFLEHTHLLLDGILDIGALDIKPLIKMKNLIMEFLIFFMDVLKLEFLLFQCKLFLFQ